MSVTNGSHLSKEVVDVKKPRILLAITPPYCAQLLEGHMRTLRAHGYEVAVLCAERPSDKALEGAEYIQVRMKREISILSDLMSLLSAIQAIRRWKPDLVNAGTPKAGLIIGLAAWLCRVPHRIYTCYGLRLETLRGWKKVVVTLAERISGKVAHRIIALSESLRQQMLAMKLAPENKTEVLHFGSCKGVDASKFEPIPERMAVVKDIRQKLGIPEGAIVVGFVGRLTKDKGVDVLIEAFMRIQEQISNLYLLILGEEEDGDPIMEDTRRAIAREPRIVSGGFQEDPAPYYLLMTMLILPSYREGFGSVILEAGAAGIPTIACDVTGIKDAVVDGVTGYLVPVGDADQLTLRIIELLQAPSKIYDMGQRARELVKARYVATDVIAAHEKLYNDMLQSARRVNVAQKS